MWQQDSATLMQMDVARTDLFHNCGTHGYSTDAGRGRGSRARMRHEAPLPATTRRYTAGE